MVALRGASAYSLVSVMCENAVDSLAPESVQWRPILHISASNILMQPASPVACSAYVICHLQDIEDFGHICGHKMTVSGSWQTSRSSQPDTQWSSLCPVCFLPLLGPCGMAWNDAELLDTETDFPPASLSVWMHPCEAPPSSHSRWDTWSMSSGFSLPVEGFASVLCWAISPPHSVPFLATMCSVLVLLRASGWCVQCILCSESAEAI